MPIYEYECEKCGNIAEAFQSLNEKSLNSCERCSGKMHKIISQSTFHLKGTGWYVTDYSGKKQKSSSQDKNESSSPSSDSAKTSKKDDHSAKTTE